jgi:hypothetical protein
MYQHKLFLFTLKEKQKYKNLSAKFRANSEFKLYLRFVTVMSYGEWQALKWLTFDEHGGLVSKNWRLHLQSDHFSMERF